MLKKMIHILFMLCVFSAAYGDSVTEERLNYRIIIPDNPSDTVKFAAEELNFFLSATYGKSIRLNGAVPEKITFLVGFPAEALKRGFADIPPTADFPADFAVFRRGNTILICGNDDPAVKPLSYVGRTGTLLGVHYFLKTYTGTSFFAPTQKGVKTKAEFPIEFRKNDDIPTPSFEVRGFSFGKFGFSDEEMVKFMKRMLGVVPKWASQDYYYDFTHSWKKRFWETRPDLFAIHGGKRYTGEYPYHFPCLSNPEVLEQITYDIIEAVNRRPDIKVIRFFCDAPYARCQCEKCKESPVGKYLTDTDNSEEIYTFLNKIAAVLHKTHPDLMTATQTKDNYHLPPKTMKLEPGFVVEILTPRPYENRKQKAAAADAVAWEKAGAKTMLKSYQIAGPYITAGLLVDYYRNFEGKTRGDKWSDLGYKTPYSFNALNLYVQMSTLFSTKKDAPELISEFCANAYPGAENEMIEFYRAMEEIRPELMKKPIHPDVLKKPGKLLAQASAKVNDDFWLKQLKADFEAFCEPIEKERESTEEYLKQIKEYRTAQESSRNIIIPELDSPLKKGSAAGSKELDAIKKLKFFPLKPYKDFQESSVTLATQEKTLYLSFTAMENKPEMLSARCLENHQGHIWLDDCFEFMIAPPDKVYPYYQFIVNSKGTYRVILREDQNSFREAEDVKLDVKTEIRSDRWTVCIAMPLDTVRKTAPDGKGRIGIFRTRVLEELHAGSNQGRRQTSGVRISGASYHDVAEYCNFTLKESKPWYVFPWFE